MPIVEKLLYDEQLQVRLAMAGFGADALVLRVLGHAHQAWDVPHPSSSARTQQLLDVSIFFWEPQLSDVPKAAV